MKLDASDNKVPRHIGFILDGNRRFAKRLMIKPWKGHEWGAKKVEEVLDWCKELGVKEVTLYAFSIENFENRPRNEFNHLMDIFRKEFMRLLNDKSIYENKICIRIIGRLGMFPKDMQKLFNEIMEKTKNHDKYFLNFALAYGGRAEIIDATKKIAKQVEEGKLSVNKINEEVFANNLYLNSDPDLIIRTSGEKRTSGFLLWQGSYAEFFFCKKFWPEFKKEDLLEAVNSYIKRERRFGR